MNTTLTDEVILKTDVLGRVKTPAARREGLLDEFERSGLSGRQFAELAGIKYQTFATWAQKRMPVRLTPQNPHDPSSARTMTPIKSVTHTHISFDQIEYAWPSDSILGFVIPSRTRREASEDRSSYFRF